MIAENRSLPEVPADSWRAGWKSRANDGATYMFGQVGGILASVLGDRAAGRLGILMFHRIASKTPGVPAPTMNVTPTSFREQLAGLKRRGFHFLALRETLTCHAQGHTVPKKSVVVTFDDCFETVYTEAWPTLKELEIPAALFLSTAYLDAEVSFPFDTWGEEFADRVPAAHYRPLQSNQCLEMAKSGLIELGTHTHTHADFRDHVDAFTEEMQLSVEILRDRFGVINPPFSLPFGSPHTGHASPVLVNTARQSNVACALTTAAELVDLRSDPFGWGRINVFPWDTSATLAGKLTGWYDWAPRWKHRLKRILKRQEAP